MRHPQAAAVHITNTRGSGGGTGSDLPRRKPAPDHSPQEPSEGRSVASWRLVMRFPGARKFAAVAVPFALVAGALAVTAAPAYATRDCTTNTMLLAQAQAAENEGDGWVFVEEDDIDEGNY